MKTLDDVYGITIRPAPSFKRPYGYDDWEVDLRPASSSILDEASAALLKAFMDRVAQNWAIGKVLVNRVTILYLVDELGRVRFAIEEAVEDTPSAHERAYRCLEVPYLVDLSRTDKKLGHPTLVDCLGARVAGHIMFQPAHDDHTPAYWSIDAWSGRYGRNVTEARRESRHVDQVIAEFSRYGIDLRNDFGPRDADQ